MSARIASHAACLIGIGAAKSGKPWERLTALWRCASRVISRMTDSVNELAFCDRRLRLMAAILAWRSAVENAVILGSPDDPLHVVLRLGERNVVDELIAVESRALGQPPDNALWSCVVRGKRRGHVATKSLQEI